MAHTSDLFSIGEFSQITGLSVKALRFYDEKGLLKPVQVDPSSGYRFYNRASAERARLIARLRSLQFSLEQIGEMLDACDDEADLLSQFERQRRVIEQRIRADRKVAQALAAVIESEREAAKLAGSATAAVVEKAVEPLAIAGIRFTGRYQDCGSAFATLGRAVGRHVAGTPLCLYFDGEYREEGANIQACVPVKPSLRSTPAEVKVETLPAVTCLSLVHRGPYPQLGRTYEKLLAEAKRRAHPLIQPSREIYIKGPGMIFRGNPARYLTEVQLPISRA